LRSAVLFTVLLLAAPAARAADAPPGDGEEATPNKVARIHFRGNQIGRASCRERV